MSDADALTLFAIMQRFSTEEAAREYLENKRWPDGPYCPHCGSCETYRLTPRPTSKSPGRKGLLKCKYCRKQFTVTVGTIFEDSHIPLNKRLIAVYLMCSSKKGISAHQLHRMLDLTYKSAWFMCHRIRFAMEQEPEGKLSGIVEADETYIGGKPRAYERRYTKHNDEKTPERKDGEGTRKAYEAKGKDNGKLRSGRPGPGDSHAPVFAYVQRGGGVRAHHVERVTQDNLYPILRENVEATARLMTDQLNVYHGLGQHFASHETVNHQRKEYVRGDVTTNTIESFFALIKRGLHGTYHHWSKKHLHRYVAEFQFRYNARKVHDSARTDLAIRGTEGKRLKYYD